MKNLNKKEDSDKEERGEEKSFNLADMDDDNLDFSPEDFLKILKEAGGGNIPASMTIKVKYSNELECLTGKSEENVFMSCNAPFEFLLGSVFSSHPKISERYKPGKLGFKINGKAPKNFELLLDGNEVEFFVM